MLPVGKRATSIFEPSISVETIVTLALEDLICWEATCSCNSSGISTHSRVSERLGPPLSLKDEVVEEDAFSWNDGSVGKDVGS